jgi:hypothetical protein
MSENHLPTAFPTRQAAAIPGRSRRGAVTGKLKTALDLMVWDNLKRKDAATQAGLADASLRFAFRKPHVMAYYRTELTALRENLRAKNIHRLDGIADDSTNDMARVGAIKTLEAIGPGRAAQRANGQYPDARRSDRDHGARARGEVCRHAGDQHRPDTGAAAGARPLTQVRPQHKAGSHVGGVTYLEQCEQAVLSAMRSLAQGI